MKQLIYIAEDEKNIRETLQRFLENDGYEVCAFETGDALLSAFFKKQGKLPLLFLKTMPYSGLFKFYSTIFKIDLLIWPYAYDRIAREKNRTGEI